MDDPELARQRRWFDSWLVNVSSRLRQGAGTVTHSLLLTVLVIAVVGVVLLWLAPPSGTNCIVRLEFAGSPERFDEILTSCGVETAAVVASLGHDLWFIAGYAIGLWLLCMIGARAFVTGATSRAFVVAAWCAVVAGVFDLAEDAFLKYCLDGLLMFDKPDPVLGWTFRWAEGMALVKFVALLPALAVSVLVVVIVAGRLVVAVPLVFRAWRMVPKPSFTRFVHKLPALRWAHIVRFIRDWRAAKRRIEKRAVHVDRGSAPDVAAAWKENYRLPAGHRPETGDVTGVCLSGGGIRAATFSLGAVQSLAAAGILERAQFLSTVSGGGYFGAAYQNLRHLSAQQGSPLSTRAAFAKGTAEEDHVRRHGKYIADGAIPWVKALFVVLRNTAMSLGIVYACLVLAAWGAAYAYSAPKEWSAELFPGPQGSVTVGAWAAVAIAVPLALALLTWAISGFGRFTWRSRLQRAAGLLAGLGIAVAVVGVVIPVLTSWVADNATSKPEDSLKIGTFAAILGTATTVWNTLSKYRPETTSGSDSSPSLLSKVLSAAAFALRFLLTLAVVIAATALALVVFLAELHNAMVDNAMVDVRAEGQHWLPIAAGVALLLLFALFDQTRMSMHPFYKARLASAFDVLLEGGVAKQPDYSHLSTLSDYGHPLDGDGEASPDQNGGLRLVLCAAAHVSGPSLAPPGRRVVPFVFSSDFIGSPKLGYFPTKSLENALETRTYKSDITLLAASAISGAAFASSMGRASGPFDLLLALSNARLGAWLPNPRYHGLRKQRPDQLPDQDRHRTALPKIRRLGYFAREVLGVYPANDRFVYVTDGGHYENLGLVELLRRRCSTIYCVDASGDHSMAFTLAEAAALAYEELGVTITIDGFELAAMSAEKGEEPNADLRSLHERLSNKSVVLGTFSYPPEAGSPAKGILIVGKATLGQDLEDHPEMFPLKSYAATQKDFPGDTTADQWFEVDQFQGYVALGRLVGQRMSEI